MEKEMEEKNNNESLQNKPTESLEEMMKRKRKLEKNNNIKTQENEDEKEHNNDKEFEENKFQKVKKQNKKDREEIRKEFEKETYLKNKNKKKKITISILIIALIIMIFSVIFSLMNYSTDKIVKGVSIEGIEISNLSKEEANKKLSEIYNKKKETDLKVKYEELESTINPTLIEVDYKLDKALEEACLIGKQGNIIQNNYEILKTMIFKKDISVEMKINDDILKQNIQDLEVKLPGMLLESSYSIEDNKLIVLKGKKGLVIEEEKLFEEINNILRDVKTIETTINIPVRFQDPEPIDIEKIHEEIYTEAKDAYYEKEPFKIYPEVEGIDFDIELAKKILSEEKDEYEIPLKITKPKITINQIGTEAFPNRVGHFTTRYDQTNKNRTTNLVLATNKLNGKVILPGETFSYNKTLGPRTARAGYKNAKIYEAGQVVDGLGGGICQISTTLYNAALEANLEIVERRNHQFVTSYIGPGRDATVVYGLIDFKFKNTRKYPIRLQASARNGIATVSIYSIKEENEYTFNFRTKTVATTPAPVKYIDDPNLEAGKEIIEKSGTNGLRTETYITKMLNGKIISTRLLSKDKYDPMERVIRRGTKNVIKPKPEQKPEQKPENKPNPEEKPEIKPNPEGKPNGNIDGNVEENQEIKPDENPAEDNKE